MDFYAVGVSLMVILMAGSKFWIWIGLVSGSRVCCLSAFVRILCLSASRETQGSR